MLSNNEWVKEKSQGKSETTLRQMKMKTQHTKIWGCSKCSAKRVLNLKINCQVILPAKWVSLGTAENCNLLFYQQISFFGNSRELQFGTRKLQQNHRHEQRRGGSFTEERGSLGGLF